MYNYDKNQITINNFNFKFEFEIRNVIQYKENYIVLLSIPFKENYINNIFCLNNCAKIAWQSEDLNSLYPDLKNLPYEQMGMKEDLLFASDFYGRNYEINTENGKIIDCKIVR